MEKNLGKCQPFQETTVNFFRKMSTFSGNKAYSHPLQRGREIQSISGFRGNSFNSFQGLYAHMERCQTCQSVKVKVDLGFSIFRKVNNNIYIIIYFEHFLLQNEFDTFDFDTFDTHFVNEIRKNAIKVGLLRLQQ